MREFSYVSSKDVFVLAGGWWWTLHDGGEVRERVLEDDGTRGWQLRARLRSVCGS